MMERGYSILFLADRNQFNMPMSSGQWILNKFSTPKDKFEGIALFDSYDSAYERAQYLVWIDHDMRKHCDILLPLQDLKNLIRKVQIRE